VVIDFHVHGFTDELAPRAIAALSAGSGLQPRTDGTVSGIEASMKKANIYRSVILSIATKPHQTSNITRWSAALKNDSIIPFASIHPDSDNWKSELSEIYASGIKGIKFHPEYQNFFIDDPKMYPIYYKAAELGLIMIFHAGVDVGLQPPYHCMPDRMRHMVRAFNGAKIVAAHMGGYDRWNEVEEYLVGEELYFDTSFSMPRMGEEQFMRIVKNHGYKRLLFGTDSPWSDQAEDLALISSLKLSDEEKSAILGGNAAKLLGLT